MELFVARQPIFDLNTKVVAYEMLYRSGSTNSFDDANGDVATSKVINAVFYSPEGAQLLNQKTAFVNFPQSLLLNEAALAIPPSKAVIEILETVEPTPEIVSACKRLRTKNYKLALDDIADSEKEHPLAEFANYIKVDFLQASRDECARIAKRYKKSHNLIAEKVETEDDFRWAVGHGFSYFQGYFFAKPVTSSVSDIPGFKLNFLEILRRILEPEMNFQELAALIKREASLSYKLLRAANSALYGTRQPARTVEHAMMRVGENEIRKLLSVIVMIDLASDTPNEVMISALLRARFAEVLAFGAGLGSRAGELFTLGLFSRLDIMVGQPIKDLISGIELSEDVRGALLNPGTSGNAISKLWSTVLAYETGNWDEASPLIGEIKLHPEIVRSQYSTAVHWADTVFHP
jgi:c-di-GMP-related signal transduction protein